MINRNYRTAGKPRLGLSAWFAGLALLLAAQWPVSAQSTVVTVTNASLIDLQNALFQAESGPVTIYLNFTNTITTTAPLNIEYNTTLIATTTNSVIISGGGNSEVFFVDEGVSFVMGNITVSGGNYLGGAGAAGFTGGSGSHGGTGGTGVNGGTSTGGGLRNLGTTILTNCTFLTNTATAGVGGSGGGGGNGTGIGGNGGNGGNGGASFGGAIYNETNAVLIVSNCTFSGNIAFGGNGGVAGTNGTGPAAYPGNGGAGGPAEGGAIYNAGLATIWNSTFTDNFSQGGDSQAAGHPTSNGSGGTGAAGPGGAGGGIYNIGTNYIVNSTFFLNLATGGNGGNGGTSTTAFGGNGGNGGNGNGGSLCNAGAGVLRITNCTFAGGASYGGTNGVAGSGPFAGNSGSPGGSFGANIMNLAGNLYLKNSILAYPTNGTSFRNSGTFVDGNNNLCSDASAPFTQTNSFKSIDPKLQSLGFNGGPTETMPLAARSPAITNVYDNSAPAFDQRGIQRPIGIRPCIGAFEYGLITYTVSGQVTVGTQFVPGVVIRAGGVTAVTDVNGEYSLKLGAGTYTIVPQNSALFKPFSTTITVPPSVADLNFNAGTNVLGSIALTNGAIQLNFLGFSNFNYSIQAVTNLSQPTTNWQTLTNVAPGAGGAFSFTDFSTNFVQRFYRAVMH